MSTIKNATRPALGGAGLFGWELPALTAHFNDLRHHGRSSSPTARARSKP